jgi:hypothetical protein
LPGTSNYANGPQPGFYDPAAGANHTLDGEPFQGPAPRPLDPFPLALAWPEVEIATHALCPHDLTEPPSWCGSGEGPRALRAGQVIVLLPPGARLQVIGGPASGASRSVGDQELRSWGAEVAHSAAEMEQVASAGANVLWLHQDALPLIDQTWVRSQYDQGRAVGVLDGTMSDLSHWFGHVRRWGNLYGAGARRARAWHGATTADTCYGTLMGMFLINLRRSSRLVRSVPHRLPSALVRHGPSIRNICSNAHSRS